MERMKDLIRGHPWDADRRSEVDRTWTDRVLSAVPILVALWILAVGCIYLSRSTLGQGLVLVISGACLASAWLLWRRIAPTVDSSGKRQRLQSLLPGERSWLFANDEPPPTWSSREFVRWMVLDSALALSFACWASMNSSSGPAFAMTP
jgi:hypothetical protein